MVVSFYFEKDGEIDPNSSSGKLHAQVLGMVAEIERDGIAENVAMGMEAIAKAGEFNGGTPPIRICIRKLKAYNHTRRSGNCEKGV